MTGGGTSFIGVIFGSLYCRAAFDCNLDFDQYGGIVLWLALMLYMFKALGTICDEYFVPSLEVIVEKLDISNDVAGATFMAAGSSAPELFTSLVATFLIVNEGGVGTIVGSAIFNILVIVGIVCIAACQEKDLPIWWYPLTRDTCFYALSVLELMLVLADEEVVLHEGLIMIATYLLYCLYMKLNPRIVAHFSLAPPEPASEPEGAEAIDDAAPEAIDDAAPVAAQEDGATNVEPSETWEDPVQKVKNLRPPDASEIRVSEASTAEGASSKDLLSVGCISPMPTNSFNSSNPKSVVPSTYCSTSSSVEVPGTMATALQVDHHHVHNHLNPAELVHTELPLRQSSSSSCTSATTAAHDSGNKGSVKWSMKKQKSHGNFTSVLPSSTCSSSRTSVSSDSDPRRSASKEPQRTSSKEAPPKEDASESGSRRTSKERCIFNIGLVKPDSEIAKVLPEVPVPATGGAEGEPQGLQEDILASKLVPIASMVTQPEGEDGEFESEEAPKGWCRDPLVVLMELIMPGADRFPAMLFGLSILFIGVATYLMVDATNRIGIILKAPPLFMGLIFLAAGTSIPDAMGSIAVAKQGEGDMAVANSLGSNVFDILIGLGVPWTLRIMMGKKVEFQGKADMLMIDIGILAAVLFLFISALVLNRWKLSKKLGFILMGFYGFYIVYNITAVWLFKFKEADDD